MFKSVKKFSRLKMYFCSLNNFDIQKITIGIHIVKVQSSTKKASLKLVVK